MGYSTLNNGAIKDFWPDDDEDTVYLFGDISLDELLTGCVEKWGCGISYNDLTISSEHIHTECLTYDQYDGSDYTNFIVVRREK
jgi:hypothetical protein